MYDADKRGDPQSDVSKGRAWHIATAVEEPCQIQPARRQKKGEIDRHAVSFEPTDSVMSCSEPASRSLVRRRPAPSREVCNRENFGDQALCFHAVARRLRMQTVSHLRGHCATPEYRPASRELRRGACSDVVRRKCDIAVLYSFGYFGQDIRH